MKNCYMLSKNKIKFLNSLSLKKNRDELGLFIAEGNKIINEIRTSPIKIIELIGNEKMLKDFSRIDCDNILATSDELKKISSLQTPHGIVAVCEKPRVQLILPELKRELTIALDDIQDPGNLGTIIRLASWFGIKNVVCSMHTADCYNPKVIQATMGAIAKVSVHYVELSPFIYNCNSNEIPVYGTFMKGENLYTSILSEAGVILMGNEGRGISNEIESMISRKITIPNYSNGTNVESLNVSIATSIICSEFRRRFT